MQAIIIHATDTLINTDRVGIRDQLEDLFDDQSIFETKQYSDKNDLLRLIHEQLKVPLTISACNLWETKEYLYIGYFVDISDVLSDSSKNPNMLASQISYQNVSGDMVITKNKINYEIFEKNIKSLLIEESLSDSDFMYMCEKIFIKDGIVIPVDGDMSLYQYIVNPMEHLILSDNKYMEHYIYHEYEVYTHVIIIIVDTREINGRVNERASFLAGKPVHGTVFVASYKKPEFNEIPPYCGITLDRINVILNIRQKSSALTTGMQKATGEYINFDKLLELENNKYINSKNQSIGDIIGESLNISSGV